MAFEATNSMSDGWTDEWIARHMARLRGETSESVPADPVNKYNVAAALERTADGIVFASKHEMLVYQQLKVREKAGQITELQLQPKFVLQEAFDKNGIHYREISYRADFSWVEDGKQHVADAKGYLTELYKAKRKLFELRYPNLTIEEL